MRFPTEGVGEVRGNQVTAHKCYTASLWGNWSKETLTIDDLESKEETQRELTGPMEELEELSINQKRLELIV